MANAATSNSLTWALRLASFVLAGLLAYLCVRIVISLTNPESVWTQPEMGAVSQAAVAGNAAQTFSFTTDPFSRGTSEAIAVVEIGEDAPETTLNLKLTGLVTGPNGSAILRTPDNKENVYRIDDEIISGVSLQAVNKDFIVISVDGQIQRLTFERSESEGLQRRVPETALQNTALGNDIGQLFQNVSLRRSMKNGQLQGYSVRANRPGLDISKFGFAKGDIITSISGADITQGRPDFVKLFQEAAQKGSVNVTVLRNGQPQIIKLGAN